MRQSKLNTHRLNKKVIKLTLLKVAFQPILCASNLSRLDRAWPSGWLSSTTPRRSGARGSCTADVAAPETGFRVWTSATRPASSPRSRRSRKGRHRRRRRRPQVSCRCRRRRQSASLVVDHSTLEMCSDLKTTGEVYNHLPGLPFECW